MVTHLVLVQALSDSQSAYRQFHCTETVICSEVNDLQLMMDKGKCSILILLDLSAAFDTVVHELLLTDLKEVDIVENALDYIRDYLVKIGILESLIPSMNN